jgi:branched-subunit amino acid aminotransferase/4-amino-4-deoxychorismate lyase
LACEDARVIELDGRAPSGSELSAALLTGYACYTTMLVVDGRVRGLPLHLHRLAGDCRELFAAELDTDRVRELAARAGAGPVVVRVTVLDPDLDRERPGRTGHPRLLVTTRPAPSGPPSPVRLRTAVHTRELAPVKHVGLLGALHQRALAQRAGYDDALLVTADGELTEAVTANLALLAGERLVLPVGPALPGVTEALLRQVAADAGLSTVEAPVRVDEVPGFPAAVLTNAVAGVRPVAAIDHHGLDPADPGIAALGRAYAALPGDPLLP